MKSSEEVLRKVMMYAMQFFFLNTHHKCQINLFVVVVFEEFYFQCCFTKTLEKQIMCVSKNK